MSSASPADLAVTFRSVPRRMREAQGSAQFAAITEPAAELHVLLAEAGHLLGAGDDPVVLADAVEAVHPEAWDDEVLARLREIALDIGRLLRHMAALAEND